LPYYRADAAVTDSITVVRSRGPRLAKLVHPGGVVDSYDACRTVDLFDVSVDGLGALEEALRELQSRWDCAVVRGGIVDPARTSGVRRLLHADSDTGEPPTLVDVPRQWLPLDIDGLPVPPGFDLSDLLACGRVACAALPAAFHDVTLLVQATGSHAVVPGLHLRLWGWLSRPITNAEAKAWLKGAPVDHSVFNAAQLIYTAAPLFAAGMADPLPERIAVRFGRNDVVPVPDAALLTPPRRSCPPAPGHIRASAYASNVLAQTAARILTAARGQRHRTIIVGAHRLAELERHGLLRPEESELLLQRAAKGAGLEDDRGADALKKEVGAILRWARRACGSPMQETEGTS
jgi:putative DNA primase/helicase